MMTSKLSYSERAKKCHAPLAKHIFELMEKKQTNLCVAADVTNTKALLTLADQVGPHICLLKTHVDILNDFTPEFQNELTRIADKHNFLIFEDRKFADIGNTVKEQYQGGLYKIADWADIINAHSLAGAGIIDGLQDVAKRSKAARGLLLIAEMSSKGNLLDHQYTQKTLEMAISQEKYRDFVIGFITQRPPSPDSHWINATPGIQLKAGTDNLQQQYNTPETAILDNGTDIIIVGRAIFDATHPNEEAIKFKQRGWEAYLARTEQKTKISL